MTNLLDALYVLREAIAMNDSQSVVSALKQKIVQTEELNHSEMLIDAFFEYDCDVTLRKCDDFITSAIEA